MFQKLVDKGTDRTKGSERKIDSANRRENKAEKM